MIDQQSAVNIGEPVTPAPVPSETPAASAEATTNPEQPTSTTAATEPVNIPAADKALAGMVSARNPAPATPAVGTLPADYLRNGYFKGEGQNRYMDPALIDQEEQIAAQLAADGVTVTAINRMVKTLKDAKKLPFEGQRGAIKKLLPLALKEKKPLLRELVEKNRAAVQTEADFAACLEHFQEVAIFLAAAQSK